MPLKYYATDRIKQISKTCSINSNRLEKKGNKNCGKFRMKLTRRYYTHTRHNRDDELRQER